MTASPTDAGAGMPGEFCAKSAKNPVGLPSEEEILRVIQSVMDRDNHALALRATREIHALIGPAIEQMAATRDSYYRTIEMMAQENAVYLEHWQFEETRALSAEAKLAQAVEALGPFASYHEDTEFLDDKGQPLPDAQHAGYVYLTLGDFRRARSASRGETTTFAEGKEG